MIVISKKKKSIRDRASIHCHGDMRVNPDSVEGAFADLEATHKPNRYFHVAFSPVDLPALRRIVAHLEKQTAKKEKKSDEKS